MFRVVLTSTIDVDVLGRKWRVTSPMGQDCEPGDPGCIESSMYRYSTLDNVTVADDPDGGMWYSLKKLDTQLNRIDNVLIPNYIKKPMDQDVEIQVTQAT